MAGMFDSFTDILGGLYEQDRNARAAADQRQADERGAERQMSFQSTEAVTARQFAERMATTQHQRQVADMRAAGLNPILSGTGGHGASSPTAPMPSGSKAGAALQSANTAVSTANQLRRTRAEMQNMEAMNENIRVDTDKKLSEKALNSMLYNRTRWEAEKAREDVGIAESERSIRADDAKGRKLEGQIDESRYGEVLRYINRALGAINSAGSLRERFRRR